MFCSLTWRAWWVVGNNLALGFPFLYLPQSHPLGKFSVVKFVTEIRVKGKDQVFQQNFRYWDLSLTQNETKIQYIETLWSLVNTNYKPWTCTFTLPWCWYLWLPKHWLVYRQTADQQLSYLILVSDLTLQKWTIFLLIKSYDALTIVTEIYTLLSSQLWHTQSPWGCEHFTFFTFWIASRNSSLDIFQFLSLSTKANKSRRRIFCHEEIAQWDE